MLGVAIPSNRVRRSKVSEKDTICCYPAGSVAIPSNRVRRSKWERAGIRDCLASLLSQSPQIGSGVQRLVSIRMDEDVLSVAIPSNRVRRSKFHCEDLIEVDGERVAIPSNRVRRSKRHRERGVLTSLSRNPLKSGQAFKVIVDCPRQVFRRGRRNPLKSGQAFKAEYDALKMIIKMVKSQSPQIGSGVQSMKQKTASFMASFCRNPLKSGQAFKAKLAAEARFHGPFVAIPSNRVRRSKHWVAKRD